MPSMVICFFDSNEFVAAKKAEQPVKSPVKATKTKPVEGSFLSPDGRRSGRLHSKKEK